MSRHMHFHREIDGLKQKILQLGGLVEDRVRKACALIQSRDGKLAEELLISDWQVDDMEIMVEEECLKVLALHQPVARDLRLIVAIMKINNELERMADIAVNIAKRVLTIEKHPAHGFMFDYQPMADKVLEMVKLSLDALVAENAELARKLFLMDEEIDQYRNLAYKEVVHQIGDEGGDGSYLINTYLIARHLERLADRTTNIAEEIIYLVEGEIVRGGGEII